MRLPGHFTRLKELDSARAEPSPGLRLDAMRRAGRKLRTRLAGGGPALGVRTYPLARYPISARRALGGLPRSPALLAIVEATMHIIQAEVDGRRLTVLVNPIDPERAQKTPCFARRIDRMSELGVGAGWLAARLPAALGSAADALAAAGIAPEDVDYVAFDHMHYQDVRGLLGTSEPEPGRATPTPALLPRARLLVQRAELRALEALHPLQAAWYVRDAVRGVARERIIVLDGDYLVGRGLAILATPGLTEGHQTIAVATDRGLWTISGNGVAVDAYAPHASDLGGLRRAARGRDLEVVPRGGRERGLDQHTAMVLEKTLADPAIERPEFPQCWSSAQLVGSPLAPGLSPSFRHRTIRHGLLAPSEARIAAPARAAAGREVARPPLEQSQPF